MRVLIAFIALAATLQVFAATYYVDYAGGSDANNGLATNTALKAAPGMTGEVNAVTPAAGDIFVLKGGVTWGSNCFPWTLSHSGASGNPITFTTDRAWYSGGSWTQPVMDAEASKPVSSVPSMLVASGKSHLVFNDLKWINYGSTGVENDGRAMDFLDGQNITITTNVFETYSWLAVYIHFETAGTYTNFVIRCNDASHTTALVWFASAAANVLKDGVTLSYNTIRDFTSQIGDTVGAGIEGGVHGDGFWHSYSVPPADESQVVTNLVMAYNHAFGDFRRSFGAGGGMTAFIFTEDAVYGKIYNNVMVPYPVQASMFDGFMVLGTAGQDAGHLEVYNNTIVNPGTSSGLGIHTVGTGSITLKNNLVTGLGYAVFIENTPSTLVTDYNSFNSGNSQLVFGAAFQSYAQWQAAGRDSNSTLGVAPTFVDGTNNLRLAESDTAALNKGTTLTAFADDYLGAARTAPWDIGAYEFSLFRKAILNGTATLNNFRSN